MPELIDRQALIKDMCNNKTEAKCPCYPNCYPCDFSEARRIIDIHPTIEAEPVRHGRWQWAKGYVGTMAECSVCGLSPMSFYSLPKNQIGRLPVYKYCPRCGARMDGGADNG